MTLDDEQHATGLTGAAGRAAFFPARAAARLWREELEGAIESALSSPEVVRAIDRTLAGPLPEEIARSLVRHGVIERAVAELQRTGELDRLVAQALASRQTLELTDRVLQSAAVSRAVTHVASSPEVGEAIRRHSRGLAEDVVGEVQASAVAADDRVERALRRGGAARPRLYAGVATRGLGFAIDLVAASALVMSAVGLAALVGSLVGGIRPAWLVGVLLSVGWTVAAGAYFVLFWSTTGQTPGMRLLGLRLRTGAGVAPSAGRSLLRYVSLLVAIAPMFAGFLPILFDARRRGLADLVAGTTVVYDGRMTPTG